jgi:hypothetical protein
MILKQGLSFHAFLLHTYLFPKGKYQHVSHLKLMDSQDLLMKVYEIGYSKFTRPLLL